MADRIHYGNRGFSDIRTDIKNMIKDQYPDVYSDFNDASIGSMMIDLNAGVANNLSINLDRSYQETQLDYAQKLSSVDSISRTFGFNRIGKRPSLTLVDFVVDIPVLGDSPNKAYYPVLLAGSQVVGGGKIFETMDAIDWGLPTNSLGIDNRTIKPNYNANGQISSYTVTKREFVISGRTSVYKKYVSESDIQPFAKITLPETDVIEITSIIQIPSKDNVSTPTESDYRNNEYRFHEVDFLAQSSVFLESGEVDGVIKKGIWYEPSKKFIKEFDSNGFCTITFGSGDGDKDIFKDGTINAEGMEYQLLMNYINNNSLGEKLKRDSVLFIKYRTGGGSTTNIAENTINTLGNYTMIVSGPIETQNNEVRRSITVSNPIPATGGRDEYSVDEIRYLTKYNFSSHRRAVTVRDYEVLSLQMPSRFGSPYKIKAFEENNKIVLSLLGLDSSGKLSNVNNSTMKDNLAEYLSNYRMVNDYVEIRDGQIHNISVDVNVLVENSVDSALINAIKNAIAAYFMVSKHKMGDELMLGSLSKVISNVNSVINVISISVYALTDGLYSENTVKNNIDYVTKYITPEQNIIFPQDDGMFEIKYPDKDIKITLTKNV